MYEAHISSTKKSTILLKTLLYANYLKVYQPFEHKLSVDNVSLPYFDSYQ